MVYLPIEQFKNRYQLDSKVHLAGHSDIYMIKNQKVLKIISNYKSNQEQLDSFSFLSGVRELTWYQHLQHKCIPELEAWSFRSSTNKKNGMILYLILPQGEKVSDLSDTDIIDLIDLLSYLQSQGIGYCDWNCNNLIRINNQIKVIDFGLTRIGDSFNNGLFTSGFRYSPGYNITPYQVGNLSQEEPFALAKVISSFDSKIPSESLAHIFPQDLKYQSDKHLLACSLVDDFKFEKYRYQIEFKKFDYHLLDEDRKWLLDEKFSSKLMIQLIQIMRSTRYNYHNEILTLASALYSMESKDDINYLNLMEILVELDGRLYYGNPFDVCISQQQISTIIYQGLYRDSWQGIPCLYDKCDKTISIDYIKEVIGCWNIPYQMIIPVNQIYNPPPISEDHLIKMIACPELIQKHSSQIYWELIKFINCDHQLTDLEYYSLIQFLNNNFVGEYTRSKIFTRIKLILNDG